MSGNLNNANGGPVATPSLWTWNLDDPNLPYVTGYYNNSPTKTGLTPQAVRDFAGVPLVRYGRPPVPMQDNQLFEILRSAEDSIEQETNILLCPTSVASPPARSFQQCIGAQVVSTAINGGQQIGKSYDLADSAYDFKFDRSRDDGWLEQSFRYKPLRILDGTTTATKQLAYIYPLLNEFFQIPNTWYQEDLDFAFIRIVPAVNITVLPLFALQLSVQGFSNSVPGGIWYWYTAGLTPYDYTNRFRFIKQLVLCEAAMVALMTVQGTINQGLDKSSVLADGVQTQFSYRPNGVFSDLIAAFRKQKQELMDRAAMCVGGVQMEVL
jgi:hypothetical protein